MRKTYLVPALLLLLATPWALAHNPPGPKQVCESSSDWSVHDYLGWNGPTGTRDGNMINDCDGDGSMGADDGHQEFAVGGAILAAASASSSCLGENADHAPQTTITVIDAVLGGGVAFDVSADAARDGSSETCGDHLLEPCGPGGIDQVTCNGRDHVLHVVSHGVGSASNAATPGFDPGDDGSYHVTILAPATGGHVVN